MNDYEEVHCDCPYCEGHTFREDSPNFTATYDVGELEGASVKMVEVVRNLLVSVDRQIVVYALGLQKEIAHFRRSTETWQQRFIEANAQLTLLRTGQFEEAVQVEVARRLAAAAAIKVED